MGITISKALKKEIAAANAVPVDAVEEELWSRSSKSCSLCEGELNRSADSIEVDHDRAQAEGGSHEFSNLRLTHGPCNRFKRNNESRDVRPYLKFKRFYEENGSRLDFATAQPYFNMSPVAVHVTQQKDKVIFELPMGKTTSAIFSEKVGDKKFDYCFVDLRLDCVTNDTDVQPRDIKLNHVFGIASDLIINPLHEQPTCRLDVSTLKLFDGQHKALAKALVGSLICTYKVYLNLGRADATVLVNSVQSKIRKLPLTPFELAAKLTDELRDQLDDYQNNVGQENASEEGFIASLSAKDRTRAKSAIEAERIDAVMKAPDLEFKPMIDMKGHKPAGLSIKETTFQNKVLKKLLFTKPLPDTFRGEQMRQARDREVNNVVKALNILFEVVYSVAEDGSPSDEESTRAERMARQSALEYVSGLIKRIVHQYVVPSVTDFTFLERTISEESWTRIKADIVRMAQHPIWIADLSQSAKTRRIQDSLSKNQDAESFLAVMLTAGYCAGMDTLPPKVLAD
jgi:hypothetical protein